MALLAALAGAACQLRDSPHDVFTDISPEGDDVSPTDDSPVPQAVFGVWHLQWHDGAMATPEDVSPVPATAPSAVALADGSLAVVTTSQETAETADQITQTFYLMRKLPGGLWRDRDPLTLVSFTFPATSENAYASALIGDADANPHVFFSYAGTPAHLVVVDNEVSGEHMASHGALPWNFSAAFSPAGVLHAAVQFADGVVLHEILQGGAWEIVDSLPESSCPALAFDMRHGADAPARLAVLQLVEGVAANLAYYTDADGAWQGGRLHVDDDVRYNESPHLAVDGAGLSHILAPSSSGLQHLWEDDSVAGGWRTETVWPGDAQVGYPSADLAIVADTLYAVFRSPIGEGYFATRGDSGWTAGLIDGVSRGFLYAHLTVDPTQNLHAFFEGSMFPP
jgi:hypothetical protein